MAMGIVSDDVLAKELNNSGNKQVKERPGRKEGDCNVPESLRKVIAQDAIENGRASALELASSVGVSASSVSAYTNGATSTTTYGQGSKELIDHNNQVKERISKRARGKLLVALHHITPEKLKNAKVKDVAAIARNMSAIVRDMEPREVQNGENASKVNINIFAPQRRQESEYEIIDVTE